MKKCKKIIENLYLIQCVEKIIREKILLKEYTEYKESVEKKRPHNLPLKENWEKNCPLFELKGKYLLWCDTLDEAFIRKGKKEISKELRKIGNSWKLSGEK